MESLLYTCTLVHLFLLIFPCIHDHVFSLETVNCLNHTPLTSILTDLGTQQLKGQAIWLVRSLGTSLALSRLTFFVDELVALPHGSHRHCRA